MSDLIRKRQYEARKFRVKVAKKTFVLLRPRPGDIANRTSEQLQALPMLSDFVVDWESMTEADLMPSGGPEEVEFDKEIWVNWLYDHPEVWTELSNAIADQIESRAEALEEAAKN